MFARIEHITGGGSDDWEVRGRDGLLTRYGTLRPDGADATWRDPAAVADPQDPAGCSAGGSRRPRTCWATWSGTSTGAMQVEEPGHRWDMPLLARISYADYGDRAAPSFLVRWTSGTSRGRTRSPTTAPASRYARRCGAARSGSPPTPPTGSPGSRGSTGSATAGRVHGVSLLTGVDVVGIDDRLTPGQAPAEEAMPPLTFGYSGFDPTGRRFEPVTGPGLPTAVAERPDAGPGRPARRAGCRTSWNSGRGSGYWRNAGGGRFELPRPLAEAPPLSLADPGVQFLDADGDGRADLVVSSGPSARRQRRAGWRGTSR